MKTVALRGISLFVAIAFTVTTLSGSPSQAFAATGMVDVTGIAKVQTELRKNLYAMPSELASLVTLWEPPAGTSPQGFVVQIQDAHANPEGQQNVAGILNYLETKSPGLVVGLEGAAGALHPEYLDLFKEFPDANRAVVEDLKQKGELNGAEIFLLKNHSAVHDAQRTTEKPDSLSVERNTLSASVVQGVETPALYRENLKTFRDLLFKRDEIQALLNPIRALLEKDSSQKLNGELRDFLRERNRRKEGRFNAAATQADPDLQAYVRYLEKQVAKTLEIDLKDSIEQLRFPSLMRLVMIDDIRKSFDQKKAKGEWEKAVASVKASAQSKGEKEFAGALTAFAQDKGFIKGEGSTPSIPMDRSLYPRKMLEGLFRFAKERKLSFAGQEAFWQSWKLMIFQAEINVTELLSEMDALEEALIQKLALTEDEKALVLKLNGFDLLEKMLRLELSRVEYDKALSEKEALRAFAADSKELMAFTDQAYHFYDISLQRDEALVANLLSLAQKGGKTPLMVLYSGGFHTPGVEESLRAKNIGYAVFSPRITKTDHGEMYQNVMSGANADLTAFFKVKNPFLTKQEALFFKQVIEIAAPVLSEKYQLKPDQVATRVAQAVKESPVLSEVVTAEPAQDAASVRFQPKSDLSALIPQNSSVMPEANLSARSELRLLAGNAPITKSGPMRVDFTTYGGTEADALTARSELRAGMSFEQRVRLIQVIFPQLSLEARKILLRPDVLTVFLGVKPAYIRYGTQADPDPHPMALSEDFSNIPEAWRHFGILFTDQYIVSLEAFQARLAKEGRFLVDKKVISEEDMRFFLNEPVSQEWVRRFAGLLDKYTRDIPGRDAFHGFLMGFALEDINYIEQVKRAGTLRTMPDSHKFLNYYATNVGEGYLSPDPKRVEKVFREWDMALHTMYTYLSRYPGFEQAMLPQVLQAFQRRLRSEMRERDVAQIVRRSLPEKYHSILTIDNLPVQAHAEGPELRAHLQAMLDVLNEPTKYLEIPGRYQAVLADPINWDIFEQFIALHDLGKMSVAIKEVREEGNLFRLYPAHEARSVEMMNADTELAAGLSERNNLIEMVKLHGALYFVEGLAVGEPAEAAFEVFVSQIDPNVNKKRVLELLIAADFMDTIATKREDGKGWQSRVQNFAKAFEKWSATRSEIRDTSSEIADAFKDRIYITGDLPAGAAHLSAIFPESREMIRQSKAVEPVVRALEDGNVRVARAILMRLMEEWIGLDAAIGIVHPQKFPQLEQFIRELLSVGFFDQTTADSLVAKIQEKNERLKSETQPIKIPQELLTTRAVKTKQGQVRSETRAGGSFVVQPGKEARMKGFSRGGQSASGAVLFMPEEQHEIQWSIPSQSVAAALGIYEKWKKDIKQIVEKCFPGRDDYFIKLFTEQLDLDAWRKQWDVAWNELSAVPAEPGARQVAVHAALSQLVRLKEIIPYLGSTLEMQNGMLLALADLEHQEQSLRDADVMNAVNRLREECGKPEQFKHVELRKLQAVSKTLAELPEAKELKQLALITTHIQTARIAGELPAAIVQEWLAVIRDNPELRNRPEFLRWLEGVIGANVKKNQPNRVAAVQSLIKAFESSTNMDANHLHPIAAVTALVNGLPKGLSSGAGEALPDLKEFTTMRQEYFVRIVTDLARFYQFDANLRGVAPVFLQQTKMFYDQMKAYESSLESRRATYDKRMKLFNDLWSQRLKGEAAEKRARQKQLYEELRYLQDFKSIEKSLERIRLTIAFIPSLFQVEEESFIRLLSGEKAKKESDQRDFDEKMDTWAGKKNDKNFLLEFYKSEMAEALKTLCAKLPPSPKSPGYNMYFGMYDYMLFMSGVVHGTFEFVQNTSTEAAPRSVSAVASRLRKADGSRRILLLRKPVFYPNLEKYLNENPDISDIVASQGDEGAHWVQLLKSRSYHPSVVFVSEARYATLFDEIKEGDPVAVLAIEGKNDVEFIHRPSEATHREVMKRKEEEQLLEAAMAPLAAFPAPVSATLNYLDGNPEPGAVAEGADLVRADTLLERMQEAFFNLIDAIAEGGFDFDQWYELWRDNLLLKRAEATEEQLQHFQELLIPTVDDIKALPHIQTLLADYRDLFRPMIRNISAGVAFRGFDLAEDSKGVTVVRRLKAVQNKRDRRKIKDERISGADIILSPETPVAGLHFYTNTKPGKFMLMIQMTAIYMESYLASQKGHALNVAVIVPNVGSDEDFQGVLQEMEPRAKALAIWNLMAEKSQQAGARSENRAKLLESIRAGLESSASAIGFRAMVEKKSLLQDPVGRRKLIEDPRIEKFNFGSNDLTDEYWQLELDGVVKRDDAEAAYFFSRTRTDLARDMHAFMMDLLAYNKRAAASGGALKIKKVCICGQKASDPDTLVMVEFWRRQGVPISVSVPPDEKERASVKTMLLAYRMIPDSQLHETLRSAGIVAGSPDNLEVTHHQATFPLNIRAMNEAWNGRARNFLKTLHGWNLRYKQNGFYARFYRPDIDPVKGIGSFEEFNQLKKMLRAYVVNPLQKSGDPVRALDPRIARRAEEAGLLEALSEGEMTKENLDAIIRFLKARPVPSAGQDGPISSRQSLFEQEAEGLREAFDFLIAVRTAYTACNLSGPIGPKNLDRLLESMRSASPKVAGGLLFSGLQEARADNFYKEYYRHANVLFNVFVRVTHEAAEDVFPPDHGPQGEARKVDGQTVQAIASVRTGWMFERMGGFVMKPSLELSPVPGKEDELAVQLKKDPSQLIRIFQLTVLRDSKERSLRIGHALQRIMMAAIGEMNSWAEQPLEVREPLDRAFREFLSMPTSKEYAWVRMQRYGFFAKFFPGYEMMRADFFLGRSRFSAHTRNQSALGFLERLAMTRHPALAHASALDRQLGYIGPEPDKNDQGRKMRALQMAVYLGGILWSIDKTSSFTEKSVQQRVDDFLRPRGWEEADRKDIAWLILSAQRLSPQELISSAEIAAAVHMIMENPAPRSGLTDLLYLVILAERIGSLRPSKVRLAMRQGMNGRVANLEKFHRLLVAAESGAVTDLKAKLQEVEIAISQEGRTERLVERAWKTGKELSEEGIRALAQEFGADRFGFGADEWGDVLAPFKGIKKFKAFFGRYEKLFSRFYVRALTPREVLRQMVLVRLTEVAANAERVNGAGVLVQSLGSEENRKLFEVAISVPVNEQGVIYSCLRILRGNGVVIENKVLTKDLSGKGLIVRFLIYADKDEAGWRKFHSDCEQVFSAPGYADFIFGDLLSSKIRRIDHRYKMIDGLYPELIVQMPAGSFVSPTRVEVEGLDDLASDVNVTVFTTDREGVASFITGIAARRYDLSLNDAEIDDLSEGQLRLRLSIPRTDRSGHKWKSKSFRRHIDGFRQELLFWADKPYIEMAGEAITGRDEVSEGRAVPSDENLTPTSEVGAEGISEPVVAEESVPGSGAEESLEQVTATPADHAAVPMAPTPSEESTSEGVATTPPAAPAIDTAKFRFTVKSSEGLHARPSALLVKKSSEFHLSGTLQKIGEVDEDEKFREVNQSGQVSLKSIMGIMGTESGENSVVEMIVTGNPEKIQNFVEWCNSPAFLDDGGERFLVRRSELRVETVRAIKAFWKAGDELNAFLAWWDPDLNRMAQKSGSPDLHRVTEETLARDLDSFEVDTGKRFKDEEIARIVGFANKGSDRMMLDTSISPAMKNGEENPEYTERVKRVSQTLHAARSEMRAKKHRGVTGREVRRLLMTKLAPAGLLVYFLTQFWESLGSVAVNLHRLALVLKAQFLALIEAYPRAVTLALGASGTLFVFLTIFSKNKSKQAETQKAVETIEAFLKLQKTEDSLTLAKLARGLGHFSWADMSDKNLRLFLSHQALFPQLEHIRGLEFREIRNPALWLVWLMLNGHADTITDIARMAGLEQDNVPPSFLHYLRMVQEILPLIREVEDRRSNAVSAQGVAFGPVGGEQDLPYMTTPEELETLRTALQAFLQDPELAQYLAAIEASENLAAKIDGTHPFRELAGYWEKLNATPAPLDEMMGDYHDLTQRYGGNRRYAGVSPEDLIKDPSSWGDIFDNKLVGIRTFFQLWNDPERRPALAGAGIEEENYREMVVVEGQDALLLARLRQLVADPAEAVKVREAFKRTKPRRIVTVLLVSGDKNADRDIRSHLEKTGYKVLVATAEDQALEKMEFGTYDLVIADITRSSGVSGMVLAKVIDGKGPSMMLLTDESVSRETLAFFATESAVEKIVSKSVNQTFLIETMQTIRPKGGLGISRSRLVKLLWESVLQHLYSNRLMPLGLITWNNLETSEKIIDLLRNIERVPELLEKVEQFYVSRSHGVDDLFFDGMEGFVGNESLPETLWLTPAEIELLGEDVSWPVLLRELHEISGDIRLVRESVEALGEIDPTTFRDKVRPQLDGLTRTIQTKLGSVRARLEAVDAEDPPARAEMRGGLEKDLAAFGIRVKDGKADLSGLPKKADWLMTGMREEKPRPIMTTLDEIPAFRLKYPEAPLVLLTRHGENNDGIYLGIAIVHGQEQPVAVKKFRVKDPQFRKMAGEMAKMSVPAMQGRELQELKAVQVSAGKGTGPEFYGVLRDVDGAVTAYAMQLVAGKNLAGQSGPAYARLAKALLEVGLQPTYEVMQSPSGDFIQVDPVIGNEKVFESTIAQWNSQAPAKQKPGSGRSEVRDSLNHQRTANLLRHDLSSKLQPLLNADSGKDLQMFIQRISGRSELRTPELTKALFSEQEKLFHPYAKGQHHVGVIGINALIRGLELHKPWISSAAFNDYRKLLGVLNPMWNDAAALRYVREEDIAEASEIVGRLVSRYGITGAFLAAIERVQQNLNRWEEEKRHQIQILAALGNDAYRQLPNETVPDYIRDAGKIWLIALPEIAGRYKDPKSGFYDVVKTKVWSSVNHWLEEPLSAPRLGEVKKDGLDILAKWHKFERLSDGTLKDNHKSADIIGQDGLGSELRRRLFLLWEGLNSMVLAVEPLMPRAELAVVPPVVVERAPVPPAEPRLVQGELFRSELRLAATAEYKTLLSETAFAAEPIAVPEEIILTAEQIGNYSAQDIAAELEGGVTEGNVRKARLWITMKVIEAMNASEQVGRITNGRLQPFLDKVMAAVPDRVKAMASSEAVNGPKFHVNLAGLSEQAWSEFVVNFPVVLGMLVTLRASLSINVEAEGEALQSIQKKFDDLMDQEGIVLAPGQLRIIPAMGGNRFKSFEGQKEADAFMARDESLLQRRKNVKSYWITEDGDRMDALAAGIATALLEVASDEHLNTVNTYKPSQYATLLATVMNAIQGYLQIRTAA